MPLSKKYYQMIADVLKGVREDFIDSGNDPSYNDTVMELVSRISDNLADNFEMDNPNFSKSRWNKWIFNQFPHIKERS